MAIIKPGFRPGFRGRTSPPSLGRRAYYLATKQDRDPEDSDGYDLGQGGQAFFISGITAVPVLSLSR